MRESAFQFSNPVLTNINFFLNEHFVPEQDTQEIPIKTNVQVCEPEDNTADVALTIDVGQNNDEYPFFISLTMRAKFRWDESFSDDMVSKLLRTNAPALLLGYIRPYIAQITEASPISTVHIPFMNFLSR